MTGAPLLATPALVRARHVDDDLLSHPELIAAAAAVAGWAVAGQWYQLLFLPGPREVRLLAEPGPDRGGLVLRRRGLVVQVKAPALPTDRQQPWRPAAPALADLYLGVTGLPIRGIATALRSLVGSGWRVELPIDHDLIRASALFVPCTRKDRLA